MGSSFSPDGPHTAADIVNLGYVINVIEDTAERRRCTPASMGSCQKVLIASAQILVPGRGNQQVGFGDGVLTRWGTFQKYFSQGELREYIETGVGSRSQYRRHSVVFYVFRDEGLRQQFLAKRYRHRSVVPRQRVSEITFREHKAILEPLIRESKN